MSENNNLSPQPRIQQEEFRGALQTLNKSSCSEKATGALKIILQADKQFQTGSEEGDSKGTGVYSPNEKAMTSDTHRRGSKLF